MFLVYISCKFNILFDACCELKLCFMIITGSTGSDGPLAEHGKVQKFGQSRECPSTSGQFVFKC